MIRLDKQDYKKKSKDDIIDELFDSYEEIERLKKELRKYKNPNTPPSAHPHLKAFLAPRRSGRKCGAPLGHLGINRPWNPDATPYHIMAKACPRCHSEDINVLRTARQQIDEIPKEVKPESIVVKRDVSQCNTCKLKFVASDEKTPIKGRFGVNLMVLVILLRFVVRGVLRKTASFLGASFELKLSAASIQTIIERASFAGVKEYEQLKQNIRNAPILYIDETSFSVLGKNWWVWIFRSETEKLIVIRNSRGSNVLDEILGKDYAGIVHCDCWRAYDYLTKATLQRCWAHLLRKSEELQATPGRHFHEKLSQLFEEIKKFNNKEQTTNQREEQYTKMTAQLRKITHYYSRYDDCKKVCKYINFHIESWFTCVKYEGAKPTNNNAEQAIRETVIVRKIIGAFRSEQGVKNYETLASLLATWQTQQKDIRQELHRMLTTQLC